MITPRSLLRWFLRLLLLVLFVGACGPIRPAPLAPTATANPPVTARAQATPTPEATRTPTPSPTPTPIPPTATPTLAATPTSTVLLTERLYENPNTGVRWEAPSEDWRFTEFPPETFAEGDIEGLAVLNAPDGTTFPLAFLSFDEASLGEAGRVLASDPDTFFEQAMLGLPPEEAASAERTEVAEAPALRVPLNQDNLSQILYLIVRPNGAFYLFAQAPSEPDADTVERGLAGLEFTPLPVAASPTPEPTPASPAAQRDQMIEAVVQLRELENQQPVPFEFMSREALRDKIEQDLAKESDQSELAAADRLYELLGIIPANTDLTRLLTDLYTSQIAGFYDPEEDRFYLISDEQKGLLDATDRVTFVHEYVHALQDQHYDLEALRSEELNLSDDQERAIQAVVEGDAQLVTSLYVVTELSRADFDELLDDGSEVDQATLASTPGFLRESLIFPYTFGLAFIQSRLQIGGWDMVDALYTAMPQSTEQILHPERYPNDMPRTVTLPNLAASLGGTWEEQLRDTWGEFDLRLLLAEELAHDQAERGAEGWGGDQYLFLQAEGGNVLFVLDIVWDHTREADEFAALFTEWLAAAGFQLGPDGFWASSQRAAALRITGDRTTILVASQASHLTAALAALEANGG